MLARIVFCTRAGIFAVTSPPGAMDGRIGIPKLAGRGVAAVRGLSGTTGVWSNGSSTGELVHVEGGEVVRVEEDAQFIYLVGLRPVSQ